MLHCHSDLDAEPQVTCMRDVIPTEQSGGNPLALYWNTDFLLKVGDEYESECHCIGVLPPGALIPFPKKFKKHSQFFVNQSKERGHSCPAHGVLPQLKMEFVSGRLGDSLTGDSTHEFQPSSLHA
jgi:hypothetical protein